MTFNFTKRVLCDLHMCYSVAAINYHNDTGILFASESNSPCYLFYGDHLQHRETVWEEPGGTMAMIPVSDDPVKFWAIQRFLPIFNARDSEIVSLTKIHDDWVRESVIHLPYCHRFDVIQAVDATYFIGATLCRSKRYEQDWSDPGQIFYGIVSDDYSEVYGIKTLYDKLTRNHGYCKHTNAAKQTSLYFAGDEGILVFSTPFNRNEKWSMEKILDTPTSDLSVIDLNNDGCAEIITIEPFHGNNLCIYQKRNDRYVKVYQSPYQRTFFHALKGGVLNNRPVVIVGCRSGKKELLCIEYDDTNRCYTETVIDEGGGPANAEIINHNGTDVIAVSNHFANEAVIYTVNNK